MTISQHLCHCWFITCAPHSRRPRPRHSSSAFLLLHVGAYSKLHYCFTRNNVTDESIASSKPSSFAMSPEIQDVLIADQYRKLQPMNIDEHGEPANLWANGRPPAALKCVPVQPSRSPRSRAATASQAETSQRLNRKSSKFNLPNILNSLRARSDSAPTVRERSGFLKRFSGKEKFKAESVAPPTSMPTSDIPLVLRKPLPKFSANQSPMERFDDLIDDTIETQSVAERALDDFEFPTAIQQYLSIPPTPQVMFNIAQLYLLIGDRDTARDYLRDALKLDDYFAVAWFQLGYVEYVEARYGQASDAYLHCLRIMRSGRDVMYSQLGLKFVVKREDVFCGLEAAKAAVSNGRYEAGVRPPSVPPGGIFRVNSRLARGSRAKAISTGMSSSGNILRGGEFQG